MKAVFLDRDGVINELIYHAEAGIIDSPFTVQQFKLLPEAGKSIRLLNNLGFKVIVVSNQPGVAKNHFSLKTLQRMGEVMEVKLRSSGAFIDRVYYCLHHPEGKNPAYRAVCTCRKPEPGLLLLAAQDFGLNLAECYMIGDNLTDIKAGRRAGCRSILISKMKCEDCHLMDEQGIKPEAIAANLAEAVTLMLTKWEIAALDNLKQMRFKTKLPVSRV